MSKLSLFLAKKAGKTAKPSKPAGAADASGATGDAWLTPTLKGDTSVDGQGGVKPPSDVGAWGDAEEDVSSVTGSVASLLSGTQQDMQGGQLKKIQQSVDAAKEGPAAAQTPKDKTVKSWGKILITEGGVLLPSDTASAAGTVDAPGGDSTATSGTANYAAAVSAIAESNTATTGTVELNATETDTKATGTSASTAGSTTGSGGASGPERYVPPSQRSAGATQRRAPVKHVEPLKMEDATEFPDLGGSTTPVATTGGTATKAIKVQKPVNKEKSSKEGDDAHRGATTISVPDSSSALVGDDTAPSASATGDASSGGGADVSPTTLEDAAATAATGGSAEEATTTTTAAATTETAADVASTVKSDVKEVDGSKLASKSVNAVDVLVASLSSLPLRSAVAVDAEGIMMKFKNRPRTVTVTP
eukprot:Lankesteria_metandrocarpae@DN4989_c2_g2_i2.p1